jgi:hypothetical protein
MVTNGHDLIAIQPNYESEAVCVTCGKPAITADHLIFQGIHTLAKYICRHCNRPFYHTVPVGHDLLFPSSFDEYGGQLNADQEARSWLVDPLLASLFKGEKIEVTIEKEIIEARSDVIILNCLDYRFGHAFTKLWNATILKRRYPDHGIIIFVPQGLRWCVPEGVAEIWSFHGKVSEFRRCMVNLDLDVKQLITRFSKVWLSKAYTHLAIEKVDLEKLLKTKRFDLSQFGASAPTVTFVLREDRFWQSSALEFFLLKVFIKLGLPKAIFVRRQNYLVNKAARMIRKRTGGVSLAAAGMGKHGRLASFIADRRKARPTSKDEYDWCTLYSRSHVVIGIHGSNMLIPTALAAGFIEILPRYKVRHISEDISLAYSARYALFLGRHVDQFASAYLVSIHAASMIRDFPYVYKNAEQVV